MKMNCEVIEDLLPLYSDNVCSDKSRKLVEEHLQECEKCRVLMKNMAVVPIPCIEKEETEKVAIVKKVFKQIHRRWMASLIAVFMLIPMVFIGIMGYNEKNKSGIAFSNLDDIYRCYNYLHYIEEGKYDKAVEMVDFSKNEYQLVESVADMTVDEYQEFMKKRLAEKLQEYKELGISISNIRYDDSYRWDDGVWCMCLSFDEIYPDGSKQKIVAHMNGETMYAGAFSYPGKNKTERDSYLDEILCLYSEDISLWYKDFAVTFELQEGEKAVIRRNKNSEMEVKGIFNITYGTGTSMIDEPYYQNVFETSVPGKYSVCTYDVDGKMRNLSLEEIDIEIIKYSE